MKTVNDFNFKNKKAIIRVDFNVPLDAEYNITDDSRMRAALPTIKKILGDGGSVILMSHLGRPKEGPTEKYSLKHLVSHLSELVGTVVRFASDCIGEEAAHLSSSLQAGEVIYVPTGHAVTAHSVSFYAQDSEQAGLLARAQEIENLDKQIRAQALSGDEARSALERAGLKVGFFKPIAQPHPGDTGPERSTELVARTHGLKPPQPLGLAHVERMLGDGQLDELLEESDSVKDFDGVEVVVDKMSVPYLDGASIDFEDTIQKQGFTIDNPNAEGSCACGDSFN